LCDRQPARRLRAERQGLEDERVHPRRESLRQEVHRVCHRRRRQRALLRALAKAQGNSRSQRDVLVLRMDAPRYHPVSIALHWIIVSLVLAQLVLGWSMIEIPKSPPGVRAWWFNLHKSIGLTIGVLMLLRLGWRLGHRAPPLPAAMPSWQRTAAGGHAL